MESVGVGFTGQTGAMLQNVSHSGIVCNGRIVLLGLWTRRKDCMQAGEEIRRCWPGKCEEPVVRQRAITTRLNSPGNVKFCLKYRKLEIKIFWKQGIVCNVKWNFGFICFSFTSYNFNVGLG
jgi:hypothetical protein